MAIANFSRVHLVLQTHFFYPDFFGVISFFGIKNYNENMKQSKPEQKREQKNTHQPIIDTKQ